MATLFRTRAGIEPQVEVDRVQAFLGELGDLSRRYGLGLTDGASLYLMEIEDHARSYLLNEESELTFA